jgi:hypothetical protein
MLCVVLVVGSCIAAHAGSVSQPPKTGLSYDFASEINGGWAVVMADDWVCPDGAPIYGIRWWGSYWTPPAPKAFTVYSDALNGAAAGGIDSFTIVVLPNVPAGGSMPFDHPDVNTSNALAGWQVGLAQANESPAFTVTKSTNPTVTEDVYSYYVDLTQVMGMPGGPFPQQQGTKYWLAIVANLDEPNKQWGWHEADGHWGGYALQAVLANTDVAWYVPCGGHDIAFELVIPEPGSLCALASGLTGLVGFVRRRRRLIS